MASNLSPHETPATEHSSGRISGIEAVAYTALIGLIAATASGWFDAMVPWK